MEVVHLLLPGERDSRNAVLDHQSLAEHVSEVIHALVNVRGQYNSAFAILWQQPSGPLGMLEKGRRRARTLIVRGVSIVHPDTEGPVQPLGGNLVGTGRKLRTNTDVLGKDPMVRCAPITTTLVHRVGVTPRH